MCWRGSFFPLSPPDSLSLALPLSLSCFLNHTGFSEHEQHSLQAPGFKYWVGRYHVAKKRGGTGVNHFMLYCAVKWRRPCISGHSHFFSTSHLLFMKTSHDCKHFIISLCFRYILKHRFKHALLVCVIKSLDYKHHSSEI